MFLTVQNYPREDVCFRLVTSLVNSISMCIYKEKYDDENFILNHSDPSILSMVNAGCSKNEAQFVICAANTYWLDDQHVVFREVKEGINIVEVMESYGYRSDKISNKRAISNYELV